VKLYELHQVSTGAAARLAGMSRVAFLFELSRPALSPYGHGNLTTWRKTSPMPEPAGRVVVNTTPLIALSVIGKLMGNSLPNAPSGRSTTAGATRVACFGRSVPPPARR
jgi:hypothetical protein